MGVRTVMLPSLRGREREREREREIKGCVVMNSYFICLLYPAVISHARNDQQITDSTSLLPRIRPKVLFPPLMVCFFLSYCKNVLCVLCELETGLGNSVRMKSSCAFPDGLLWRTRKAQTSNGCRIDSTHGP